MKPRTKAEKEVVRLSNSLPLISETQKAWAVKHCVDVGNARKYRGGTYDISHFIVVTTKSGWQVLRHYYLYARYRYKKLVETDFHEVMEQWFKDGEYVFMARNRCMGYCCDSWVFGQPMSIKHEYNGFLGDPRNIGYDNVYYARLQKRFSYIERDGKCKYRIDDIFRALNAHKFNETLYKKYPDAFKWSVKNQFIFDSQKSNAVKIAIRHGYDFMKTEWRDLIEMLQFLKKDIRNPKFICPDNLKQMHDKICNLAESKRRKHEKKMQELAEVRRERQRLRNMQAQEELNRKRKKEAKGMMSIYKKMRKRFFGIVIAENELEIKVLQSVQEFMEEGKEMHHCVFANGYYDVKKRPDSLMLSAKVNGKRMETLEVNLKNYTIVQCRGKYNQDSEYHDKILDLLNNNMDKIKEINKIA